MQLNIHIFVIIILNSCSFKDFNKLPISVLIFVYGWLNFAFIIFYVEYLLTSVGVGEGGREASTTQIMEYNLEKYTLFKVARSNIGQLPGPEI